ncbi:MAG: hypothetical protein CUN56_12395 [Phototrophicales bacterium]|nr:MAG: hypothetical protein CUN56_12395 [Phototrophicales bacterium]RMG73423.1 MAG: hypothetical protein D6711_10950 [Chloroflexota bacterium]
MGKLTAFLINKFKAWDRPSQIAFIMTLVLMIPPVIALLSGVQSLRQPAVVGLMGLIISAQGIIMWANRGMVTDYTRAQRAYMAGDFITARNTLETLYQTGKADYRELTLLGNTYRQLGDLPASERVLSEALNIHPRHYFPLYGFGRTLLVQGRFAEAQHTLEAALQHDAPPAIHFDLGEAMYHQGNEPVAVVHLSQALPHLDEARRFMAVLLLYNMGKGAPPDAELIAAGWAYWQAQVTLFQHTPYGEALKGAMSHVDHSES